MGELAELGRIAKAQQESRPGSRDGRYIAGTGAAMFGGGLGTAMSATEANHRDALKYAREHNMDTSSRKGGKHAASWLEDSLPPKDMPKLKGARRLKFGGATAAMGVPLMAAGGAVGLANRRRNRKFREQQG